MKIILVRAVGLWLLASLLPAHAADTVIQELPIPIVTATDVDIFPRPWFISAEAISVSEFDRSRDILAGALLKYPERVIESNLTKICVLSKLLTNIGPYGGTYARNTVFLVNEGLGEGSTNDRIESGFHHEFSSILLRNYPLLFDEESWESANPANFQYTENYAELARYSVDIDETLCGLGFLSSYSTVSREEDFNVLAQYLFMGDPKLWAMCDKYPMIRKKRDLIIGFYRNIDMKFSKAFFLGLKQTHAANIAASWFSDNWKNAQVN